MIAILLLALIIFKDFFNIITCFKCFTTAMPNVNDLITFAAILCCMASFVLLHVRSTAGFKYCATATADLNSVHTVHVITR